MKKPKHNEPDLDHSTHSLISIKNPGINIQALREELQYHPELAARADRESTNFETALASIATQLDIAVDGIYDAHDICGMLCEALRNKRFGISPLKTKGLIDVELQEKENSIELVKRTENGAFDPETTVVTETKSEQLKQQGIIYDE
jgi:hypothetical protein